MFVLTIYFDLRSPFPSRLIEANTLEIASVVFPLLPVPIVLRACRPTEIRETVILRISVDVVDLRLVLRVRDERLSEQPVEIMRSSVQINLIVPATLVHTDLRIEVIVGLDSSLVADEVSPVILDRHPDLISLLLQLLHSQL